MAMLAVNITQVRKNGCHFYDSIQMNHCCREGDLLEKELYLSTVRSVRQEKRKEVQSHQMMHRLSLLSNDILIHIFSNLLC